MPHSSVLVNFVYCRPVGHVIEALHYCHGYHHGSPDITISLALNSKTALELAQLLPYVANVYPVEVDEFDRDFDPSHALELIPTGWDCVLDDRRGHESLQREIFAGLARYYDESGVRFRDSGSIMGFAGGEPPNYSRSVPFRLEPPAASLSRSQKRLQSSRTGPRPGEPLIAVLPAGSDHRSHYPSVRSWHLVLDALVDRWPDAEFCIVGKLKQDRRTSTSFGRGEMMRLRNSLPKLFGGYRSHTYRSARRCLCM